MDVAMRTALILFISLITSLLFSLTSYKALAFGSGSQDFDEEAYQERQNISALQSYCFSDCVHEATFLKKYANQGSSLAEFALAILQIKGVGMEKNIKRGLIRLKKSAKNSEPAALLQLAHFYHYGMYYDQDFDLAEKYYLQAINKDVVIAKKHLKQLQIDRALFSDKDNYSSITKTYSETVVNTESASAENEDGDNAERQNLLKQKDVEVIEVRLYASYDQILDAAKRQSCNGNCGPVWRFIAAPMILSKASGI
jgi:TPR repeat protein